MDADCTDNLGCSRASAGYQCHTTKDECTNVGDCTSTTPDTFNQCDFDKNKGHWACVAVVLVR